MDYLTLDDLIAMLKFAREEVGGDAEVRLATQPNYPLAHGVAGVHVPDLDDDPEADQDAQCVVWITEGDNTDQPYSVPANAWADRVIV